jgi:putative membrane protein insertion efficiency factor
MKPISFLISLTIRAYRAIFSPWVGHNCRYQPTCSAYALEALEKRGAIVGVFLIVKRLLKCHPWGGQGYDPVPDEKVE